jgi:hypothetical protein
MKTIEWLARLDAANNSEEVLAALGGYVASWSSYDRAQLPESCRLPDRPRREDLARVALSLPQEMERFDIDRTRERLLKALEIFVARALVRVSQIASEQARQAPGFVPPLENMPALSFLPVGPHSEIAARR